MDAIDKTQDFAGNKLLLCRILFFIPVITILFIVFVVVVGVVFVVIILVFLFDLVQFTKCLQSLIEVGTTQRGEQVIYLGRAIRSRNHIFPFHNGVIGKLLEHTLHETVGHQSGDALR